MRLAVVVLNALAIVAGIAFLAVVYDDPRGEWGAGDSLKLLVFFIPFVAALLGVRNRSSLRTKSTAVWLSAAWAALLIMLGLGAFTGIGGFVGLLVVIVPIILVLLLNCFVLLAQMRGAR